MNVFLAMALHVLSFAALVIVSVIALHVVVAVCRRALTAQAALASQQRIALAAAERVERLVTSLADGAHDCYIAEVNAIYQPSPLAKPEGE